MDGGGQGRQALITLFGPYGRLCAYALLSFLLLLPTRERTLWLTPSRAFMSNDSLS